MTSEEADLFWVISPRLATVDREDGGGSTDMEDSGRVSTQPPERGAFLLVPSWGRRVLRGS